MSLLRLSRRCRHPEPARHSFRAGRSFLPACELPGTARGVRKEAGTSRLKLDIGSSIDFLECRTDSPAGRLRIGADFFTYALTTSAQGLRLQVDAVDGFFGGHIVYAAPGGDGISPSGFVSFTSADILLTGTGTASRCSGKTTSSPFPTRAISGSSRGVTHGGGAEAPERVLGNQLRNARAAGRSFTLRHAPRLELHSTGLAGPVGGRPLCLYIADNLAFTGIPLCYGTNNLEFGVKFGEWDGTGIRLYGSYYHGLEVFSQYYYVTDRPVGAGVCI